MPFLERLQCHALQLLGDLDLRRTELLRRLLEDSRAGILGAVDPVAEAHDLLPRGERLPDPPLGITHRLNLFEHRLHVRRRAAVQRA
jgi:hypothetical protein